MSSSHDGRCLNSFKFVRYLLSNSAPHDPRCFLASVFQRLQRNRAAASCAAGRRYPGRTCAKQEALFLHSTSSALGEPSFYRPQASWGPARYQLDSRFVQAENVVSGRHQEDPVVRLPGKYAYIDAICRNVITPLAHRFQTKYRSVAHE